MATEARIGRVLVASLHQSIADLLPTRLEFYENWLNSAGLRHGTIGLAPLNAVLSFLRTEGDAYTLITARAGDYAGAWIVHSMGSFRRRLINALPVALRIRAALRVARGMVRETYPGSRALIRVRKGNAFVDLRGSLFCSVRDPSGLPLCGFYASAIGRILELFNIHADTHVDGCRATGSKGCLLSVTVRGGRASRNAAVAA